MAARVERTPSGRLRVTLPGRSFVVSEAAASDLLGALLEMYGDPGLEVSSRQDHDLDFSRAVAVRRRSWE